MSEVEDLAAVQNGTVDAATATEHLEAMWTLPEAGVAIEGARITGRGRAASCEVRLSNGETMEFERLGDIATAAALPAELASCAGVTVKLGPEQRLRSIVLLRALAERQEAESSASIARWWGSEFLGCCQQVEVDMGDQAERWACFTRLRDTDPLGLAREQGGVLAQYTPVPVDRSGLRYVRIGWYLAHVRQQDGAVTASQVISRMLRVGWQRRGTEGRIGARRPDLPGQANLKFLLVPRGWEDLPGELVTPATRSTREAEELARARDKGSSSGYRPTVTDSAPEQGAA